MKTMTCLAVCTLICLLALTAVGGELTSTSLKIGGMTCGSCAAGLEKTLAEVDGIDDARVDYESGLARIRFDAGVLDLEDVMAAIDRAGLQAEVVDEAVLDVNAIQADKADPGCAVAGSDAELAADGKSGITDEELDRVVAWVADHISEGGGEIAISKEEVEEATGVTITETDGPRIMAAVQAMIEERFPAIAARLSDSRCSDYGACSLHGDLSGATGATLAMYEREKGEDGKTYEDYPLPAFEAQDLQGRTVRSADLRGAPAVLVLLAGHCTHSHDSLPILQDAVDRWGDQDLRVVGVMVNSGSPEGVNHWIAKLDPRYDVWVYDDPDLGELLQTHLVPSYLFIDAEGQVTEKLVGYKTADVVEARLASFMATATASAAPAGAR